MGSLPADDTGWAFEIKWDGYRTLVFVEDGAVRLQSTSGKDVTDRWPEFAGLAAAVGVDRAILDGELVVFDDEGRPDFGLVQQSGRGSTRQAVLHLFDVLAIDDTDTVGLPYTDRRRLLDRLVDAGPNWLVPAHRVGDGEALLAATAAQGLEGVIAKRLDSVYRPGTRSKDWLKIKHRRVVDVVVGGWTTGTGNRSATFGALLVGVPDTAGGLRFAGGVGTGFSQAVLEQLAATLRSHETDECPFSPVPPTAYRRNAHWVEPTLTATIEIAEFTGEGFVRHASFVGLAG